MGDFTHFSRSNTEIEIKGESLEIQAGHLEIQGAKIGVHGLSNFFGHCMDFTLLNKTAIGIDNKVLPNIRPIKNIFSFSTNRLRCL